MLTLLFRKQQLKKIVGIKMQKLSVKYFPQTMKVNHFPYALVIIIKGQ